MKGKYLCIRKCHDTSSAYHSIPGTWWTFGLCRHYQGVATGWEVGREEGERHFVWVRPNQDALPVSSDLCPWLLGCRLSFLLVH